MYMSAEYLVVSDSICVENEKKINIAHTTLHRLRLIVGIKKKYSENGNNALITNWLQWTVHNNTYICVCVHKRATMTDYKTCLVLRVVIVTTVHCT